MKRIQRYIKIAYLFATTVAATLRHTIKKSPTEEIVTLQKEIKPKILLFGYMGLGDALMFQPSLRALLAVYPLAQIDVIVSKESQSLFILQNTMAMEKRSFEQVFYADPKGLTLSELIHLNNELVERHYDAIICSYMSPSPYFIKTIESARVRVGHWLKSDKWYKPRPNSLFNVGVWLHQDHEHETSRHARLISRFIGEVIEQRKSQIEPGNELREFAADFWKKNALQNKLVIATHFGASRLQHWKKWDDEKFALVLQELKAKYDPMFLLFGTSNEEQQLATAALLVEGSSINLAGKLSIEEVGALIEKCDMLIGNDSGLGHLAMAVGVPVVRVFGMSDYWGYRSLDEKNIDVFQNVECSPCLQLGYLKSLNVHNCGHKKCMKLITVEEVVTATDSILSFQSDSPTFSQ